MLKSAIRLEFNDHIWSPERQTISSSDKKALSIMNSNSVLTTQSYLDKNHNDSNINNNSSNINEYRASNEFEITQTNKLLDSVLVDTNLNIQIDDSNNLNSNMFAIKSISNNSTNSNSGIFLCFIKY